MKILGSCCGPCFGPQFRARQISATVPWYGSFAFAGGNSTTLWLVETNITSYFDLTNSYGANWIQAVKTVVTTINPFTGASVSETTYSPGGDEPTTFNARAALEPGPAVLQQNVTANNATVFAFTEAENSASPNPGLIHHTYSDIFASPHTQDDVLALCHALIDSYVAGFPASFAAVPWNQILELSYDAEGQSQSARVPFVFPFPSTLLTALPIASQETLAAGATLGDAVNMQIGQVLTGYNTWSFFDDQTTNARADCDYHCLSAGSPVALYSYNLPATPGDTRILADPSRNTPSPCDGTAPPPC